jgi:predicted dehydrogenase
MIKIAVIGYGYWGPNLARNICEVPGAELVGVCDLRPKCLAVARGRYPGIATVTDYRELLADGDVDAIAIATPVSTHFELAMRCLSAGKHVLVEKPLAATSESAMRLLEEADRRNRVLMVDHTFVYTGAVRKIRELVGDNELGDIYYYDSVRVNLGLFQHDVNVVWDLGIHDLSIMDFVLQCQPRAVSATGMSHISGEPENTAYMTLFFDGNLIAHVHVSWLAPVKVRRTLVGGSRKMIVYDDLEPSEKVKVYDTGVTLNNVSDNAVYNMLISYRTGDMWAPHLDMTEALRSEVLHFVGCIEKGLCPLTDGLSGLQMIRILEAATESMLQFGRPVELETVGPRAWLSSDDQRPSVRLVR